MERERIRKRKIKERKEKQKNRRRKGEKEKENGQWISTIFFYVSTVVVIQCSNDVSKVEMYYMREDTAKIQMTSDLEQGYRQNILLLKSPFKRLFQCWFNSCT